MRRNDPSFRGSDYGDPVWTFETRHFTVSFYVEEERFDGAYMMPDDVQHIRDSIAAGTLACFTAIIEVEHVPTGLKVEDTLGQCVYHNPLEFIDHRGMKARGHGSYFSEMVRGVCAEMRSELRKMRGLSSLGRVRYEPCRITASWV